MISATLKLFLGLVLCLSALTAQAQSLEGAAAAPLPSTGAPQGGIPGSPGVNAINPVITTPGNIMRPGSPAIVEPSNSRSLMERAPGVSGANRATAPGTLTPQTKVAPGPELQVGPAQTNTTVDINERNEFQSFVMQSAGKSLPMFGHNLFQSVFSNFVPVQGMQGTFAPAPNTGPADPNNTNTVTAPQRTAPAFAPIESVPVTADYVIGPGDNIILRAWGQIDFDYTATVDRAGQINLPKVGTLTVSGLRFQDLDGFLKTAIGRIFRNFELNVTMGPLRSIQVFVVGQAARPGVYTLSSLSTMVSALFASGGPSQKGTMRKIQLKRNNQMVAEFDLYDLLINGDKSKDARLLAGDVIFIPPVGPLAALSGSVNTQAIFELKDGTSFDDLIKLAGGFTTTAQGQKAVVERIIDRTVRRVDEFTLDKSGLAKKLQDGDVITIASITPRFDNAVRVQGNVAAATRYAWREGMRITDILTNQNALITTAYWQRQNNGAAYANYNQREVNFDYATIQRLDKDKLVTRLYAFNLGKAISGDPRENVVLEAGDIVTIYSFEDVLPKTENDVALQGNLISANPRRFAWREGMRISDLIPNAKWLIDYYNYWKKTGPIQAITEKTPVPLLGNNDINWNYANIERLQTSDLTRTIVPIDLGKAVLEGDQSQNLLLAPGDVINVFSKSDFDVPIAQRTTLVKLEDEFNRPGIYKAERGETLRQLVARVGGLSQNAYLFGAVFTRESTRIAQQKNLDEAITRLEAELQRSALTKSQSGLATDTESLAQTKAAQETMLERLRQFKATGRIVLGHAENTTLQNIPDIPLENGDTLKVPARPGTVQVIGSVYNANTFFHSPEKRVSDYLTQAGGPVRTADSGATFILRANGAVISKRQTWMGFDGERLMPGDTIVVPENFEHLSFMKVLKDWAQILSQFGLGVAAIHVLKN